MSHVRSGLIVVLVLALAPTLAPSSAGVRADFEDPDTEGWRRLGVFWLKPTLALKDFGRDSNVFNSTDDEESDFTATVGPAAEGAIRFGSRGFLTLRGAADYVWYEKHGNLTHTNLETAIKGNLNLRSLRFFGAADYQKHEERPNSELDRRARRINIIQRAGVGYEISPKTAVDYIFSREKISYHDPDFNYQPACAADRSRSALGAACPTYSLGDLLSRTESTGTLRFTQKILGRTRLIFDARARRYDFSSPVPPRQPGIERPIVGSVRDASETRFLAGAEVEPGATLSGTLQAGVVDFRPRPETGQRRRQSVWYSTLAWRLGSRVAVATAFDRDLQFSTFDRNLYYRQDHETVQCVYYLNRIFGVEIGYDLYKLAYPTETQVIGLTSGTSIRRRDEIRMLIGGVRMKLANRTAATVRVATRHRTSNLPNADDRQTVVTTGVETRF